MPHHEGPLVFKLPPSFPPPDDWGDQSPAGSLDDLDAGKKAPPPGLVVDGDAVSLVCDGGVCYRTHAVATPTPTHTTAPPAAPAPAGRGPQFVGLRTRAMPPAFTGPIAGLAKLAVYDQDTGTVHSGIFFPWRHHTDASDLADVLLRTGAEHVVTDGDAADAPGVGPLLRALEWRRSDLDAMPGRSIVSSCPEHGVVRVHLLGPMVQAGSASPMLVSHLFSGFPAARSQWTNEQEQNALSVLRAVYANLPRSDDDDAYDEDEDTDTDTDDADEAETGMMETEGGAPPPAPVPRSPGAAFVPRITIDVDGDAVELPEWAATRCLLPFLADGLEELELRARDLPGFPAGVTGADLRDALSEQAGERLAHENTETSRGAVEAARRIRSVWKWLCCSPGPGDRDWTVLNYPDCAVCGLPFRGTAPMSFWQCTNDCTVRQVLCRECTINADADDFACPVCHAPPIRPAAARSATPMDTGAATGLSLVFEDGQTVDVPERALRGCASLSRMAITADGEPVTPEDVGLPRGIGAGELRDALAALGSDETDDDGARYTVYRWLGCQPGHARDWTVPNPEPCALCLEQFCGFAPVRFWRCDERCPSARQLCRSCTLVVIRQPRSRCPLCRSEAVSSVRELVAVKRPREPQDTDTPPGTRRRGEQEP